jgi:hypothetical protein
VAFEEPGGEFVPEQAGAGLALNEGDEVILLGPGEHAFKGVVGGGEPLLPQLFPVRAGRRSRGNHGWVTPGVKTIRGELRIDPCYHTRDAQLRNCTRQPGPGQSFSPCSRGRTDSARRGTIWMPSPSTTNIAPACARHSVR